MSVRLDAGIVRLGGECAVEHAETLLGLLQENPTAAIDLHGCTRMHLAVAQVLLAARRPIVAPPADPLLRRLFAPDPGQLPD
jgi:hypothetical protein